MLVVSALILVTTTPARGQQPRLELEPRFASQGRLLRVTIDRMKRGTDSVVWVGGEMAGEPLHFHPAGPDRVQALGAIPVQVSDSLAAHVWVQRRSGAIDTLRLFRRYPHIVVSTNRVRGRVRNARRLRVDRRFTQPEDAATDARVAHDNEVARNAGRRSQETPQLWTYPFLRPRKSRVTSRFGSGRVFNGRVQSSHLGIDYRGALGEPIRAANRGVVVVVADFFLAGNVVYIDHGEGIMTGYFHMSKPEVAVGDTVERGQEIGLVGATGRVTGPHLHWSARLGALTIDPADLLSLKPPFVLPDTARHIPLMKRNLFTHK